MKNIYLIRHCKYKNLHHVLAGRLPFPLSKEGIKQAERIKDYFQNKNIEKIYSSNVLRCQETSEIISNGKIPIEYDVRLLETFSAYQGYSFQDKKADWKLFYNKEEKLGGESMNDVQKRIVDFFFNLLSQKENRVIISAHADLFYSLIYFLCHFPLLSISSYMKNYNEQAQSQGAIREINWQDEDNWKIIPVKEF